jgi:hypothetical protein
MKLLPKEEHSCKASISFKRILYQGKICNYFILLLFLFSIFLFYFMKSHYGKLKKICMPKEYNAGYSDFPVLCSKPPELPIFGN